MIDLMPLRRSSGPSVPKRTINIKQLLLQISEELDLTKFSAYLFGSASKMELDRRLFHPYTLEGGEGEFGVSKVEGYVAKAHAAAEFLRHLWACVSTVDASGWPQCDSKPGQTILNQRIPP
jgi:hypothetical protein